MGCGPLPQPKSDCTSVSANLHQSSPAFRTPSGPSGQPSPLRGEGEPGRSECINPTSVNLIASRPRPRHYTRRRRRPIPKISRGPAPPSRARKASRFGHSRDVSRAVQHPHDDDVPAALLVVDDIVALKSRSQAWRQTVARSAGQRKFGQVRERRLYARQQPVRCRLGTLDGDIGPDFGEIGLGRFGQAERERAANSFLPRAMIVCGSNSFTRPAATSARPLSISALSAANS